MENGTNARGNGGDDDSKKSEVNQIEKDAGEARHKKSLSGGILGSLSFLKPSTNDAESQSPPKREDGEGQHLDGEGSKRSSLANALRQSSYGRKRRGSLRKAAMGTSKILRDREHRNSVVTSRPPMKPIAVNPAVDTGLQDDEPTPRPFSYEDSSLNSSSDSGWHPSEGLSVSNDSTQSFFTQGHPTLRVLASPLTSPVEPYASTTDDDDGVSFFRTPALSSTSSYAAPVQPLSHSSSLHRRRSNRTPQQSSMTTTDASAPLALEQEWDYSETEWWGWVVLVVTWVVFVVGMGSCLGVWSWAWDVGETPYAPPELEDDPTLPIAGYYPALMVCTAVMAWVWVVVAWVGMKYFRHAKVVGEDG